jgi:glutathione S-transferase
MGENLTIWTYDWVPEGPRGFVRDLRLRWGAEEAGLSYDVDTVPFEERPRSHLIGSRSGKRLFLRMARSRSLRVARACYTWRARAIF